MARGLHVGTSGWTYDDWRGSFYPEGVRGADRLGFYASRFDTVEVNATFYRLPTRAMIDAWNRRLPRRFHLVLKGPRSVTHMKKLAGCEKALGAFLESAARLDALRVILWQLPPMLHCDVPRLDAFLGMLPRTVRHAVEPRHESWWDEEVYACLRRHRVALVSVSHPSLPAVVVPTTDLLYLRFHGLGPRLYDHDYTRAELRAWERRLRPHLRGRTLYAFFNNDWHANAPKNALVFREMLQTTRSRTAGAPS